MRQRKRGTRLMLSALKPVFDSRSFGRFSGGCDGERGGPPCGIGIEPQAEGRHEGVGDLVLIEEPSLRATLRAADGQAVVEESRALRGARHCGAQLAAEARLR